MVVLIISSRRVPGSLLKVLKHCGIQTTECLDVRVLSAQIERDHPDLLLCYQLDSETLKKVRVTKESAPFSLSLFVISGKGSALDRVIALQHGISQYYLEPFSYTRLIYDIGTVQYTAERVATYSIGSFMIDPANQAISYHGHPLPLSKKQYALLHLLLTRSNRVVSRVQIWESVWGIEQYPLANCIDALVSRVRQRLPKALPCKIEQVYGIGYRLLLH